MHIRETRLPTCVDWRLYSKCNERNRGRARIGCASRILIRGRESWRLPRAQRLPHTVRFRPFHLFLTTATTPGFFIPTRGGRRIRRTVFDFSREARAPRRRIRIVTRRRSCPWEKGEERGGLEAENNFEEFYNFKTLRFPHRLACRGPGR